MWFITPSSIEMIEYIWITEWITEWLTGWLNEWLKWMNEWINQSMSGFIFYFSHHGNKQFYMLN